MLPPPRESTGTVGSIPEGVAKMIPPPNGWPLTVTSSGTPLLFRKSSGVPELVTVSGQPFGGGIIFATPSGMLPTVPVDSLGGGSIHGGVNGSTVNTPLGPQSVGTAGDPKNSGTGLNYFADPGGAFLKFRPTLLATDTNDGRNSPLRGLSFWNLDTRFGKSTAITERVKVEFSADFFNIFNH